MKVYLIKACAPSTFKEYKKYMASPPQNIFSLAATTPAHIEVEMVDETVDMKVNYRTDADVIAIMASTPDILRAYEIADKFRRAGKMVVLGGLHVTFMPDEAAIHADTLILGEAEGIWETLLMDYEGGRLQPRYQRTEPFPVCNLKPYPTEIIHKEWYGGIWTVMVSRGCTNQCSFCTVTPFFKRGMRYRPIGQVVEEIKKSDAQWIELHSDHMMDDRDYALELFKALKPLNINWVGETTVTMANDLELLEAAAESGLQYLLVGLETPSQASLKNEGKGFIKTADVKEYMRRFHAYDILVDSAFIFGFDDHDTNIFQESLDFVNEIDLDVPHATLLIPFPGTRTFNNLDAEERILTYDWSKYDGTHVTFQPKLMTPKQLDDGLNSFWYYAKNSKRAQKLIPSLWS